jgi:hypothetical protein
MDQPIVFHLSIQQNISAIYWIELYLFFFVLDKFSYENQNITMKSKIK